jgi:hypothetical protein
LQSVWNAPLARDTERQPHPRLGYGTPASHSQWIWNPGSSLGRTWNAGLVVAIDLERPLHPRLEHGTPLSLLPWGQNASLPLAWAWDAGLTIATDTGRLPHPRPAHETRAFLSPWARTAGITLAVEIERKPHPRLVVGRTASSSRQIWTASLILAVVTELPPHPRGGYGTPAPHMHITWNASLTPAVDMKRRASPWHRTWIVSLILASGTEQQSHPHLGHGTSASPSPLARNANLILAVDMERQHTSTLANSAAAGWFMSQRLQTAPGSPFPGDDALANDMRPPWH